MTDNELADVLAVAWDFQCLSGHWICDKHRNRERDALTHPFPVGDLNAVHAAWPEVWTWGRWGDGTWIAQRHPLGGKPHTIEVVDTGNTWHDWASLLLAVLRKEAGNG